MDSKKCTKRGLCRRLRQDTSQTETTGKLVGLNDGIEWYVTKRFITQQYSITKRYRVQNGTYRIAHLHNKKLNLMVQYSITKQYITENYGLIGHLL